MDKENLNDKQKENLFDAMKEQASAILAKRAKSDENRQFTVLKTEKAILFAQQYGILATDHLREIEKADKIIYQEIIEAIQNIENYEKITEEVQFKEHLEYILKLITVSSEQPYKRIDSLSYLLDENGIGFFPISKLKDPIRKGLIELCMICLGIYRESESYLTILLANLYIKWKVDPPISRNHENYVKG